MFCILYKWFISRSMDRDESLPRLVKRHVSRCPECARFAQQCLDMASRLSEEARRETFSVSPELHEKILRRRRPVQELSGESTVVIGALRLLRRPVVLTAAALVLLTVVGVYLYSRSRTTSQNPDKRIVKQQIVESKIWPLTRWPLSSESASVIEDALCQPIEEEIRLLRRDGEDAAEFLLACIPLDLDLSRREPSPMTRPGPDKG